MPETSLIKTKIKSYDGLDIYCIKNQAAVENGIVIIVHSLAEHLHRYDYLAGKLVEANLTVYRYDNRGHGKSAGDRSHLNDFKDLILDAYSVVEYVKHKSPNIPVFMLGHSMGGFIAASYGIKYKNKINGQILSGAATMYPERLKGIMKRFLKITNKIAPRLKIKNDFANIISRDKQIVKDFNEDPLVLKRLTTKFYYEFLIKGILWLNKNLKEYKYPCLILHGKDDKIINNEASKNFFNKISSTDKELKIYDKLYHEILNEKERDNVINDIISWVYKRI